MDIIIAPSILFKLKTKHRVTPAEVAECFNNRIGNFLTDQRSGHKTDPPTLWFIAETDSKRNLKVVFVLDSDIYLKTAFEPDIASNRIYMKYGFK